MSRPDAGDDAPRAGDGRKLGHRAAIVNRLAGDGWRVTGVARRALKDQPALVGSIACDLSDAAARERLLAQVGRVEAFIHAAASWKRALSGR